MTFEKQRITVLGSTGSIGVSTLEVIARHPDRFEVFALSAATQVDLLLAQCAQFKPQYAVMASEPHGRMLAEKIKANGLSTHVLYARNALEMIASHDQVDAVMAAIVGAAGLPSCMAAARAGKRLLLANKEARVMGRKISVDSATMMNKALEVIEAKYLFGMAPSQIEVVIHPQSIIHSMVQYHDTSVVAQLGTPDMRVPIAYGLAWPERISSGAKTLDFRNLANMTFEVPDDARFPGLPLAWEVLRAPVGSAAVLNAANEIAVAAFLDRRIRFDQIHQVNHATLETVGVSGIHDIEGLLALDAESRRIAGRIAERLEF
jgi:1-deoxy-D-xylulose 5-phosphate reductoisomerase